MKRLLAIGTAATIATTGLLFTTTHAHAASMTAKAVLKDASGKKVGVVTFTRHSGDVSTLVDATFYPDANVKKGSFHGFHIHANNDPLTGAGCKADPKKTPDTWFVSADGHYATPIQLMHGAHKGDMPSVLIERDGSARLTFTTDRFTPAAIVGKAVILHAKPDNFANIPVGSDSLSYKPNSLDATAKTAKTGNAGDRVACGVITKG